MVWSDETENADSPYPEDLRPKYTSGDYEITKEGDGRWWLRYKKKPIGSGPRLRDAKITAQIHAEAHEVR